MTNWPWCWKNDLHSNIHYNFEYQKSLSKSKCWCSNDCLYFLNVCCSHRYWKAKIDCLSFVMCLLLAQLIIGFFFLFFAAAFTVLMKQTRQAVCTIKQSIFLDVYGCSITTMFFFFSCFTQPSFPGMVRPIEYALIFLIIL